MILLQMFSWPFMQRALAAGVLVLYMVLQCIRLAARSEYIAEA